MIGRRVSAGAQKNRPIGDLPVGEIIELSMQSGIMREFLIVHKGRPMSFNPYQGFEDSVTLLMRNGWEQRPFHTQNLNDYQNSSSHAWLNNTFLTLIDASVRYQIRQVRIPFRPGSGGGATIASGASGLLCRAFSLSMPEVGFGGLANMPADGAKLDYFLAGDSTAARSLRMMIPSPDPRTFGEWHTRSPHVGTTSTSNTWLVRRDGASQSGLASNSSNDIRPAFVLPASFIV